MANTPFVSANLNDALALQNLRTIGLVADANETSPAAAALNDVPQENKNSNDLVEISQESRELARAYEPENITITVNRAEQAAAEERAAAAAGNENELLANTEIENQQAGFDVAEALAVETETETVQTAENLRTTEGEVQARETAAAALAPTVETGVSATLPGETEAAATEAENEVVTTTALEAEAAATAAQTVEGTVPPEPAVTAAQQEPTPEAASTETPLPIEEQTQNITRLNEVLNNINGLAGTAPVTGIQPEAAQSVQSEQQVLLQNVGTQLAQAVPPPSIISVLG